MRSPAILVTVLCMALLTLTPSARAEQWCSDGPGSMANHPCDVDFTKAGAAAARVHDKWLKIPGIKDVRAGLNRYEDFVQIEVDVDAPDLYTSGGDQIPEYLEGFKVYLETGLAGWIDSNAPPSSASQEDREAFARIDQDYGNQWEKMPGVVGYGSYGCEEEDGCRILILAQPRFVRAIRNRVPETIDGQRIIVSPSYPDC
jgi:hypothetical protein